MDIAIANRKNRCDFGALSLSSSRSFVFFCLATPRPPTQVPFLESCASPALRTEKAMTATDVTGFYAFFSAIFFAFWRHFLAKLHSLTFFHADFGKEFPSRTLWRDPSRNCPSPSSALCPLLYRTEHFSRGKMAKMCREKGEEEGWPAKGAKRKKGRVKTGQQ